MGMAGLVWLTSFLLGFSAGNGFGKTTEKLDILREDLLKTVKSFREN
jgi:hypothetical protein